MTDERDRRPWGTPEDFARSWDWYQTLPDWCVNACANTDCPDDQLDACEARCVEATRDAWESWRADGND